MFQDDRMISVLSAIVLMVAIGTVIQRADLLSGSSDDDARIVLNTDVVEARTNRLLRIDVLRNDVGIGPADQAKLAVVQEPACGRVFVQGEALQYLPDPTCSGQQIIRYGIQGHEGAVGQVIAQMIQVPGTAVAAHPTAAQVAAVPEQPTEQQPDAIATQTRVASPVTTPEQLETHTTPALAAPQPPATPGVVETLIAGTAQPAEAAVPDASETSVKADPAPRSDAEIEIAEPALARAPIAALGVPLQSSMTSDIASSEAVGVTRSGVAPKVAAGNAPQPGAVEKPIIRLAAPALEVRTPDVQPNVSDEDRFDLAAIETSDRAPDRTSPVNGGGDIDADADTGFLIAIVSRKEPDTRAPRDLRQMAVREVAIESAPSVTPSTSTNALARGADGPKLQIVGLPEGVTDRALPTDPVDLTQPFPSPQAVISSAPPPAKPVAIAAINPTAQQATGEQPAALSGNRNAPQTPATPPSDQLAALPRHDAPCVIPPAMTIDVRRAARSIISIDAPCHADTVAELDYSGLTVAVPLDQKGTGSQMVLGFEPNAPALLTFDNGEKIDFDLPFKGIGRVSRVALVWDLPINLELNAVEFGADLGSAQHVRPENPRSFEDVRRKGGGFLHSYRSHAGIGQNAQIYSFYHRRGGQQGVVEMMIDFASRNRDLLDGTCGEGKYAAPNFMVLRSVDARLDRPIIRKLAALACSSVGEEKGDKRLISGAVADLLVVQR